MRNCHTFIVLIFSFISFLFLGHVFFHLFFQCHEPWRSADYYPPYTSVVKDVLLCKNYTCIKGIIWFNKYDIDISFKFWYANSYFAICIGIRSVNLGLGKASSSSWKASNFSFSFLSFSNFFFPFFSFFFRESNTSCWN